MRRIAVSSGCAFLLLLVAACSAPKQPEPSPSYPLGTATSGEGSKISAPISHDGLTILESSGQAVQYNFEGLRADSFYRVMPCLPSATVGSKADDHCAVYLSASIKSNHKGVLAGTLPGYGTMLVTHIPGEEYSPMKEVTCNTDPGCLVAVDDGTGEILSTGTSFAVPSLATRPTIALGKITKSGMGGKSSYSVSISGKNFVPNSKVTLLQCPKYANPLTVDSSECLYDGGGSFTASKTGEFIGDMAVVSDFTKNDGSTVKCESSNDCVVAYAWPEPGARYAEAEIVFNAP